MNEQDWLLLLSSPFLMWSSWLFVLGLLSRHQKKAIFRRPDVLPRVMVVVPAHNEEEGLKATLDALHQQDYPKDHFSIHVIADHCSDKTAEVAKRCGAWVYERQSDGQGGKGAALSWLFSGHRALLARCEIVVIVDADTHCPSDFLRLGAFQLCSDGSDALQSHYMPIEPSKGRHLIQHVALDIAHRIRQKGMISLTGSAGLKGNGMFFQSALILKEGWNAFSVTEDLEFTQELTSKNYRISYSDQVCVYGQMAPDERGAVIQQRRWEGGRFLVIAKWLPKWILHGMVHGNPVSLLRALDLSVPPMSLLLSMNVLGFLLSFSLGSMVTLVWGLSVLLILSLCCFLTSELRHAFTFSTLSDSFQYARLKWQVVFNLLFEGLPTRFERTPRN